MEISPTSGRRYPLQLPLQLHADPHRSPTKTPPDVQSFTVTATNVTISPLTISLSYLQRSQTEDFRFSASYPNGAQVKTGSANLRLVEADGLTSHHVGMAYKSTLRVFRGPFQTT